MRSFAPADEDMSLLPLHDNNHPNAHTHIWWYEGLFLRKCVAAGRGSLAYARWRQIIPGSSLCSPLPGIQGLVSGPIMRQTSSAQVTRLPQMRSASINGAMIQRHLAVLHRLVKILWDDSRPACALTRSVSDDELSPGSWAEVEFEVIACVCSP